MPPSGKLKKFDVNKQRNAIWTLTGKIGSFHFTSL